MIYVLLKFFLTFFKIGAFTFGGGYAMIPLIQEEVVDRNKWMKDEEFIDILALSQTAPGAIAVNSSIFIGYKLRGIPGAIICTLGAVLPSFIIILIIAKYLFQYRNNPIVDQVFAGIRPAVAALIFAAVYKLGKTSKLTVKKILIAIAALAIIVFVNVSPVYVILAGGIGAVAYFKAVEKKGQSDN